MVSGKQRSDNADRVQDWEIKLLRKVTSVFRTPNRDDLEAELARKLLEMKQRPPSQVRDWPAYLAKLFYNKAHNFVRDERARARRVIVVADDADALDARGAIAYEDAHWLAEVWIALTPAERRLWLLLARANGNQTLVARRLGVHRNTIRMRLLKIRAHLRRFEW